eukprot:m.220824 g.220824  ORF g.220824 m.220824 type:complete len:190 (+) comp15921_c0_seq21:1934-2503(+)
MNTSISRRLILRNLLACFPPLMPFKAIISHARLDHDKAFEYYEEALKAAITSQSKDPYGAKLYIRDLAAESAYQFALLGMTNYTAKLTDANSMVPEFARHTDRFRFGAVQAAYGQQNWDEFFMLCDCAPDRLWPAIGWWGGGTETILSWYESAILQRAAEKKGKPLTVLEQNAEIRANPIPFCLRAVGH